MKKGYLFLLLLFSISLNTNAQNSPGSGFTNRNEAENKTDANGLKQGKWIEYIHFYEFNMPNEINASCYRLVVYKNGLFDGIERQYDMYNSLLKETIYTGGIGTYKEYRCR